MVQPFTQFTVNIAWFPGPAMLRGEPGDQANRQYCRFQRLNIKRDLKQIAINHYSYLCYDLVFQTKLNICLHLRKNASIDLLFLTRCNFQIENDGFFFTLLFK